MVKVCFVILSVCYISYLYSIFGVFSKTPISDGRSYLVLKLSNLTFWLLSLFLFWRNLWAAYPHWQLYLFLFSLVLSLFFFWWAQFYTRDKKLALVYHSLGQAPLVQKGPFSLMRNPFYFSYLLTYISVTLFLKSLLLTPFLLLLFFVYIGAIKKEENDLLSRFGADYMAYKKRVKRLIPYIF